jgi:glucose-1-phosphate adenylyltransferase
VLRSVLSPHVRVNSFCEIEDSILMNNVWVGRYSRIRRAILDSGVVLPENTEIGFDAAADQRRGYTVSPGGVVVVSQDRVAQ